MASDKAKTSSYVSDLTAVPLQKIVENRPLLDKLRCLDIEYKEKCNWQHLAHSFKVPQDVCKRLSSYHRQSPTKKLFFYLLSYRSDLPISELKQALKNIYRADLLSCIKDLKDDALVSDVITKTSVLETLAIELDVDTMPAPQGNWESLAHEVGIRDHLILAVIRSEYNPAEKLLEYLSSTSPDLAIGTLKAHLKSMNRGDILDLLREHKEDETLRDVIKLGTDLQFKVTHSLNNHNGWQILADKLDVPAEVVDGIRPPNERDVHSPSQGLLRFLSRERPHMTAQHLVDNLNEINRADAVWFITTHFSLPIKDETSFRERTASCPALGERHTHSRPTLQTRASTPGTPSLTAEGSAPSILPGLQESHQQDVSICHGRLSQIPFGSHGCNLERKPDIFIGREKAQASLITALLSLEHPMIGVCGVSGFGKTTLCVNASYELIEKGHFVAYVNSRHVHCTDNLAEKILREFGMTGTGSADPVRQAISLLKSFNRDVILIIENVDKMLHLFQREDKVTAIKKESRIKVDESQQILSSSSNFGTMCSKQPESSEKSFLEFITDIATYCPRIKLLVTCWERVDYFNFTVKNIELKPLTLKDSVKLLQVKSEKETGKMMPREQAEKIALYCDGYPLLLCGSSVQDLPELTRNIAPAEVHGMLDSDKKTRKRVDWCFNKIFERMDKDVRRVLVMMSVFPESFTVSDATIVTQGIKAEVVEFCLKKLTNKHCFSRYNPDTNAYTLHSAVRLFGTRKGNDDIYRELYSLSRKRFIEHYIGKLELYDGKYFSKNSQEAVQAYRQAKYNIRQIIEWCVWENKPPLDPALKLQCIDTFIDSALFLIKMMSTEEFRTQFLLLANQCESNAKRQSALFVYQGAMNVISCTCYPNICPTWLLLALHYFEKARELNIETMKCSERWFLRAKVLWLVSRGRCLVRKGNTDIGLQQIEKGLGILRAEDNPKRSKKSTGKDPKDKLLKAVCLAYLAVSIKCRSEAIEILQNKVIHICEQALGAHPVTATMYDYIGMIYYEQGRLNEAFQYLQKALEYRRKVLGEHRDTARTLYELGATLSAQASVMPPEMNQEQNLASLKYLEQALVMQQRVLDTPEEIRITCQELAVVLTALQRYEVAQCYMDKIKECQPKLRKIPQCVIP